MSDSDVHQHFVYMVSPVIDTLCVAAWQKVTTTSDFEHMLFAESCQHKHFAVCEWIPQGQWVVAEDVTVSAPVQQPVPSFAESQSQTNA